MFVESGIELLQIRRDRRRRPILRRDVVEIRALRARHFADGRIELREIRRDVICRRHAGGDKIVSFRRFRDLANRAVQSDEIFRGRLAARPAGGDIVVRAGRQHRRAEIRIRRPTGDEARIAACNRARAIHRDLRQYRRAVVGFDFAGIARVIDHDVICGVRDILRRNLTVIHRIRRIGPRRHARDFARRGRPADIDRRRIRILRIIANLNLRLRGIRFDELLLIDNRRIQRAEIDTRRSVCIDIRQRVAVFRDRLIVCIDRLAIDEAGVARSDRTGRNGDLRQGNRAVIGFDLGYLIRGIQGKRLVLRRDLPVIGRICICAARRHTRDFARSAVSDINRRDRREIRIRAVILADQNLRRI